MQYGHGSWIPIVVFGGMFLIRYLSSQRRRGGPPAGRPGSRSQFTSGSSRGPTGPPSSSATPLESDPSSGMPAGWFRDPFVRHEQRFWSGTAWTDHVLDDGVPSLDPPPTQPESNGPA